MINLCILLVFRLECVGFFCGLMYSSQQIEMTICSLYCLLSLLKVWDGGQSTLCQNVICTWQLTVGKLNIKLLEYILKYSFKK